jgi:beta-RFAP synthase
LSDKADSPTVPSVLRITVEAPARLHMGFLDMGAALGRRFGSVGVGINEIATRIHLTAASRLSATGPDADRAVRMAEKLATQLGRPLPATLQIEAAVPNHSGLGSGTQLALAVGAGLSRLYGLNLAPREVAAIIGRGARSGIGIAVFEQGGLIVDGGRGKRTSVPPVIARLAIPSEWRFIIILDDSDQGLHGPAELQAFKALPEFPAAEAARLCHLLMMRGLPAVAEADIEQFGAVITALQCSVGDHFAPAQGGRFTSPPVREALDFLAARGAVGIGQSSWGPTGFCLTDSPSNAQAWVVEAQNHFAGSTRLRFIVGTARDHGADIRSERLAID